MSQKRPTLKPSETLLPARMSLNEEALKEVRFAVLDFPFKTALDQFVKRLTQIYNHTHKVKDLDQALPYETQPPWRQLSQAIMAICPVLVHAFERYSTSSGPIYRMVAINRLGRDPQTGRISDLGDQFPPIDALAEVVDTWLDQWLSNADLKSLVEAHLASDWKTLKTALGNPETQWELANTLDEMLASLNSEGGIGFQAIGAVVVALLHGQTITLTEHGGDPLPITWRKAHNGGAQGLHLISQPFHAHFVEKHYGKPAENTENADPKDADGEELIDGYFVYSLYVSVQTQVGRRAETDSKEPTTPWIFLKVGMRRLAHESLSSDKNKQRDLTVLVGLNRESLMPEDRTHLDRFPHDSTLIALPIKLNFGKVNDKTAWSGGIAKLLAAYALSASLADPRDVLRKPRKFGNLDNDPGFTGNEYYPIHAEGRTYLSEPRVIVEADTQKRKRGHAHHVEVGYTLKERTEVVQRVLEALPDVLIPDQPFAPDIEMPMRANVPKVLRNYSDFTLKPSDTETKGAEKIAATVQAIRRAVRNAGKQRVDVALLCADRKFMAAVKQQAECLLAGYTGGDDPFILIHEVVLEQAHIAPLDPGELNPQDRFNKNRADDFFQKWHSQMVAARPEKVDQWRKVLAEQVPWRADTYRAAIIESWYKDSVLKPVNDTQAIKSAVREACVLENVASQFILHFKVADDKPLSAEQKGKIENALLDLLLRGTGALYGAPAEMYETVAELLPSQASTLDVVAFAHVQTKTRLSAKETQIVTVIAVRLRADGCLEAFAPSFADWMPYPQAGLQLGFGFVRARSALRNNKTTSASAPLRMKNEEVARFVMDVLRTRLTAPTIAVIEADWWRNTGKPDRWPQLANKRLFAQRNELNFYETPGGQVFTRQDRQFENLLAIVRLRTGDETPQYTIGTDTWDAALQTGDLAHLSGYIDNTVTEPFHYFSAAGKSGLQRAQFSKEYRDRYKLELDTDLAYKHANLVEMLPFFVRADLDNHANLIGICRCVHFLRVAPAFTKGNIFQPYPLHVASSLLDDLLCVVDAD